MSRNKQHVVVVGNGMVGFRFCEKLLEYDAHHRFRVTVLGEEPVPAYDRIALTSAFGAKRPEELTLAEVRWYTHYKIDLRLNTRVEQVERNARTVVTSRGETIAYDKLVLATGARANVPQVEGAGLDGVYVYRTVSDLALIKRAARKATRAVVVGGGLLGLEAAAACRDLGLETQVVERAGHLLPCQLDAEAGGVLRREVEASGLSVRIGEEVRSLKGDGSVEAVHLCSGEVLPAELVVWAIGITPNDELGHRAGLELGARGGIAIASTAQTSDPDIYAIGECAAFQDATYGLAAPGYAMAEAATAHLCGLHKTFESWVTASQLKLYDVPVASLGNPHAAPPAACVVVDQDVDKGVYKKVLVDAQNRRLLGAILVGETSEFDLLRLLMERQGEVPEDPASLLAPIGKPLVAGPDLEEDDLVCFCNYVTKFDICKAIDEKQLKTTVDVMGATYAGGLCGSCLETVAALTKYHLATRS